MSQQYPSTWNYCATCAFWQGARETDYFGQRVTVVSSMDKGKCAIPRGPWKNQMKQASFSCQCYMKWPCLK